MFLTNPAFIYTAALKHMNFGFYMEVFYSFQLCGIN